MFFVHQVQVTAQEITNSSLQFLKGKYQLDLMCNQSKEFQTVSLLNNLPGIYQIEMLFEIADSNGNIHVEIINKRAVGRELVFFQSMHKFQKLSIKEFTFHYRQFGEDYCLHWDSSSDGLKFRKQDIDYNYANPFTLCATNFYWPLKVEKKSQITEPDESQKVSVN